MMHMLTFKHFSRVRLKLFSYKMAKLFCSNSKAAQMFNRKEDLIEVLPDWPEGEDVEIGSQILKGMKVLPDFVTEAEETALMKELEPYLKKMRYEFDHWDNAIQGYRETERAEWHPDNRPVIHRLRELASRWASGAELLAHTHVLDLAADGYIKPHVDSVRYCGEVIAGACLLSPAVMSLSVCVRGADVCVVRALLPRRAAYVLSGAARHRAAHAVLPNHTSASRWRGAPVQRGRRVSLICRSAPPPPPPPPQPSAEA